MEEDQSQPMDNITQAIMQYIDMRTDYAVMLTGEWGSGKTFYVNNVLKKAIEKHEDYMPIVISLFGVGSIEELSTKILIETYPFFTKVKYKNWSPFAKVILRGAISVKGLGDIDKYIGDLKGIPERLAKYKRSIIIFDDFERKDKISTSELTGYINALVEDESSKVIIVANESEVPELKNTTNENIPSDYHALKEKIVRSTFRFESNFSRSLQDIIEVKYGSAFPVYRSFLNDHIELINRRFVKEANSKNLRTLSFALELFQYVFSSISNRDKSEKKYKKDQIEKYLREMFLFTMAVCIEYRRGEFQNGDPSGIDSERQRLIYLGNRAGQPEEEVEKDFAIIFIERYYENTDYRYFFFRSLFDFIVGKGPFQTEKAIGEIDTLIERDNEKPEWHVYDKMRRGDHFFMSNSDFEHFYGEVLGYAIKGLYPLDRMLSVSNSLVWMATVLGKDLRILEQQLKQGIEALFNLHDGDDSIDIRYPGGDYHEIVQALIQFAIEHNEAIKKGKHASRENNLNNLMERDFGKFIEELESEKLTSEPVLSYLDVIVFNTSFRQIVKGRDNNSICRFSSFINNRYRNTRSELLKSEREFFMEFSELLLKCNLDEPTLTAQLIRETEETVKNILEKETSR